VRNSSLIEYYIVYHQICSGGFLFDFHTKNRNLHKNTIYMKQVTRIGFGSLGIGPGSVTLPPEVTLVCPVCETEVADKGQCIANFEMVPSEQSKTGMAVKVLIDCRNCGAQMIEPGIKI
jgi:hypothetical protein